MVRRLHYENAVFVSFLYHELHSYVLYLLHYLEISNSGENPLLRHTIIPISFLAHLSFSDQNLSVVCRWRWWWCWGWRCRCKLLTFSSSSEPLGRFQLDTEHH